MVEQTPHPTPQECLMDRGKLAEIDKNVKDLALELRTFISSEGPFANVRERVTLLESRTIDNMKAISDVEESTASLVVKVAGATAILSLGGVILILKILGVISG